MLDDFELAFKWQMGEEGVTFDSSGNILSTGLNTTPGDPGGTTNFGFAQKYHPSINVAKLDWESAKQLAHDEYWIKSGADQLPWPNNVIIYDTYFNQSQSEAQALKFAASWEDMLWARLAQYAAKHPANLNFTRWWLKRVLSLRSFILDHKDA